MILAMTLPHELGNRAALDALLSVHRLVSHVTVNHMRRDESDHGVKLDPQRAKDIGYIPYIENGQVHGTPVLNRLGNVVCHDSIAGVLAIEPYTSSPLFALRICRGCVARDFSQALHFQVPRSR